MVKLPRRRRPEDEASSQVSTATDTLPARPQTEASPAPGRVGTAPRSGARGTARALLRAAHPRYAVLLAVALAIAAACTGRAPREVVLVGVTVLVGQIVLGWHNDLVDRGRDAEHQVPDKPVAGGRLDPGTVWFAVACAVLLLVPLTVTNGITAGSAYLLAVLVGVLGNVVLRQGVLSWVTWAASYALLPAFLSYGGFGGQAEGDPPRVLVTVLAALVGAGVHLVGSVWGLEPDAAAGWKTLPLRLGRRMGSTRLLVVSGAYLAAVLVALVVVAAGGGLSQ